jgi:hypothetical protein
MDEDIISHIRSRVDRCRRLAASTTDKQVAAVLLQMAAEGDADLRKLQEQAGPAAETPKATPPEAA